MSIKLNLSLDLSCYTNNQQLAEVNGNTVGECLDHLTRQYPDIKEFIYTEDGKQSSFIDVYVNGEYSHPDKLSKPVKDGDEFNIMYSAGG